MNGYSCRHCIYLREAGKEEVLLWLNIQGAVHSFADVANTLLRVQLKWEIESLDASGTLEYKDIVQDDVEDGELQSQRQ